MLGATCVDTLIVPVTFYVVETLVSRRGKKHGPRSAGQKPEGDDERKPPAPGQPRPDQPDPGK